MSEERPTGEPIRVGLLLCDHLDPGPAAVAGDYTVLYPAAFGHHGLDIRVYEATTGELPSDLDECEVWMTSGSRRSAYEDEGWIHDVADVIARLAAERRPHAGICFGHQLTALALGGDVQRADVGWGVGGRTFDVVDRAPWMDDVDRFTILMSHRDQVTRLPDGAELVATSAYCPVGAYRVEDHVFCVQGHPEFVPDLSATLMEMRREAIGTEVVDAGLASLAPPAPPLDQDRVAGWIAAFYRRALGRA
jgi:GMP synthase (glutamine-hydrolysing)